MRRIETPEAAPGLMDLVQQDEGEDEEQYATAGEEQDAVASARLQRHGPMA